MAQTKEAKARKRAAKEARKKRREQDRALAPPHISQRLEIPITDLARAMRAAGITAPPTTAEAELWAKNHDEAPAWLNDLRGERLASSAEAEYRDQLEAERRELRAITVEQNTARKVEEGAPYRRFTRDEQDLLASWAFEASKELARSEPLHDFNLRVLRLCGVDPENHETWPIHVGNCDGVGRAHCNVRTENLRIERRVEYLIESVAKEAVIREAGFKVGQHVLAWYDSRVGVVVKINRVTVKVRLLGTKVRGRIEEKNLDPRYVSPAPDTLPAPPAVGDEIDILENGTSGRLRHATVLDVDGPLFEATYTIKSGETRTRWYDLLAIRNDTA